MRTTEDDEPSSLTTGRRRRAPLRAAPVASPAQELDEGLHHAAVDGVDVFWADVPGPKRAMLQFRSGVADETFSTRGINHLVEHLSLSSISTGPEMVNGFVDLTRTAFFTGGSERHITTFVRHLCRLVHDLPSERFDHERRVLRAEAQGRGPNVGDDLLTWRFGARSYGLSGYREWGLETLGLDDLHRWTAERFVAGNAVLWLTFPPPDDLALDLPGGHRHPLPEAEERTDLFPSAIRWGVFAGLSWPSQRTPESAMAEFALGRHVEQRLRHTAGTSYSVAQDLLDIGPDRSLATLVVDAAERHHQSVTDAVHEVVTNFAVTGHNEEDVEHWRHGWEQSRQHPDSVVGVLDAMARRSLFGQATVCSLDWMEAAATATPEAVASVLHRGLDEAIHVIPHGATPSGGVPMLEIRHDARFSGRRWHRAPHARPESGSLELVVGEEGIRQEGGPSDLAVRWDEVVGVLAWDDGSRLVVGSDATEVALVPHRWVDGDTATSEVDGRAPDPNIRAGRRLRAPDLQARGQRRVLDGWAGIAALFGAMWLIQGITGLVAGEQDGDTPPVGFILLGVAALAFAAYRILRHRGDRSSPRTWDNAADRWNDTFPSDAPSTGAYNVGGLCMGWLASNDLMRTGFAAESGTAFEEFRDQTATPMALYVEWDGILTTDMVCDRGNAFLRWYFREPRNGTSRFDEDLHAVVRGHDVATFNHLPDDWAVLDDFSRRATKRYEAWSRWRGKLHRSAGDR